MSTSFTIGFAVILLGALILYAAVTKRSVRRLLVGDATPGTGGGA